MPNLFIVLASIVITINYSTCCSNELLKKEVIT